MNIEGAVLLYGDCLDLLRTLPDNSVDAVVTDPPYGIKFMGRKWDCSVPGVEVWAECLRVLKPGGHLLAFAGTRTQHRMAVNIEDAGFEIRDMIAWVYGSGFPKSMDVSKAIDRAAGAEREVVGKRTTGIGTGGGSTPIMGDGSRDITAPATEAARQWEGWGTALKPALEPITVARKPLAGTVAANVLEHGTGALNVDGCRVELESAFTKYAKPGTGKAGTHVYSGGWNGEGKDMGHPDSARHHALGRFPSNLIHDGSDEVMRLFPETKSGSGDRNGAQKGDLFHGRGDTGAPRPFPASSGSAARFFYCPKASGMDREGNTHPTVKPTELMRYLCRLVTPPGGTVLDPFAGSGSTGVAALLEGFKFIGMEREAEYLKIAEQRISNRTRRIQQRLSA